MSFKSLTPSTIDRWYRELKAYGITAIKIDTKKEEIKVRWRKKWEKMRFRD